MNDDSSDRLYRKESALEIGKKRLKNGSIKKAKEKPWPQRRIVPGLSITNNPKATNYTTCLMLLFTQMNATLLVEVFWVIHKIYLNR